MSDQQLRSRRRWSPWLIGSVVLAATVVLGLPRGSSAETAPPTLWGLALQGFDEFDGAAGQAPDPRYWDYDVGGGGWGNGEQQVYTNSRANSRLDGDGHLLIQANQDGSGITSARLVTRGKRDFGYGLLTARIKFPVGQGVHPAFWLLGSDITSVGWPECGEIDVMELINAGVNYHTGLHGPWNSPHNLANTPWHQSTDGPAPADLSRDYHTYSVLREPNRIRIMLDDRVTGDYRRENIPLNARWAFDGPMYVLLNIAVGGNWPGPIGADTVFPLTLAVDWVRFYA